MNRINLPSLNFRSFSQTSLLIACKALANADTVELILLAKSSSYVLTDSSKVPKIINSDYPSKIRKLILSLISDN